MEEAKQFAEITKYSEEQPVEPPPKKKILKSNNHYLIAAVIFILCLVIAAIIVYYQPVKDYLILRDANPSMIALAQQAGMSRQGELIFLGANPQFASDAQMRSDCSGNAAANNKNGFIEQGCFVPNPSNHTVGRIYIRQMPPNLYDQEIVTAAYEMLHAVYFNLVSGSQSASLIQAIETNYNRFFNTQLNAQVINFARTEPGYRDLELFSLLGTEYLNVSTQLNYFYAPYFTGRNLTVDSYNRVTTTFNNDQTQLNQLSKTIASDASLANSAYVDSIAWAKLGNSYEDSYNYNIYKNYVAQQNIIINQYNQLSSQYNTLDTQYNGSQPVNSIQNIQTQAAK